MYVDHDTLNYQGADRHAGMLRRYWLDRGYNVRVWIEAVKSRVAASATPDSDETRQATIFCVRSTLVDGTPPESAKIVQRQKAAA